MPLDRIGQVVSVATLKRLQRCGRDRLLQTFEGHAILLRACDDFHQLLEVCAHLTGALGAFQNTAVAADYLLKLQLLDGAQRPRPIAWIAIADRGKEAMEKIAGSDYF